MTTTRRPSSTRLRTALPLASLTALALLGATGCSTESRSADPAATTLDTRSPGAALDAAVTATLAAERFTLESSASLVTGTGTIDFTATGRTDRATLVGDLRCEIGYGGDTTTVHALSDGTTAWVSSEGTLATTFPAGATYVAGDASRLSDAYLCQADGLLDLVHVLAAGDQARVGDAPSGADARRYSFTTTCAAAVEAAGDGGDALATALDLARGSGDAELTVTATVGPTTSCVT